MKANRLSLLVILSLLVLAIAANVSYAQGVSKTVKEAEQKVTVKGTINFMEKLGGYYVMGEDPAGEFMIVNQNPNALKRFMESKKKVTIEGRLRGADFLFIEKIDGKKYTGKVPSK